MEETKEKEKEKEKNCKRMSRMNEYSYE